ncbi:threonine-phosphate decarboxylase CobD [Alsobacter sp. SYSU BS001988]
MGSGAGPEREKAQAGGEGALFYHGGALAAARARFPGAPQPWIDLSTGINPVAYPVGDLDAAAWTRLPEAAEIAALEADAARAYGARSADAVVAAPGTQAAIQLLPGLLQARRVGVLGFAYAEHARCFARAGAETAPIEDLAQARDFDVVVVVNPNNPDGRHVPPAALLETAAAMRARGGTLVVDEAFADLMGPAATVAPAAPEAGALVLRSFGKTYGLAGLRLGFVIAPPALAGRVRAAFGPWAVSGPAVRIGRRAFSDPAWLAGTARRLDGDGRRLDALLERIGLRVVGGTALFRLAERPRAADVFAELGRRGILVRPFAEKPTWLRWGLPGPDAWDLLAERLAAPLGA